MRGIAVVAATALLCFVAGGQNSSDALFQAIRNNDLAFLKAEFRKGADVNTRDRRGSTLLMHAAAFGSPEAVKLLIDSGADVNAKNSFDATALVWGARDARKARMLVEKGADVNARSKQGRTPLMIAAACDGCTETVRLLLAKGADPKAKDSEGSTAMNLAAAANDLDTMRLLIEKGAEANAVNDGGFTPLMDAASNCNLAAVQLLLSKGANVNAANTFGGEVKFGKIQLIQLTPLMLAAPFCPAGVVKTLLDEGANVNAKDIRGMTPLMLAVSSETQDQAVLKLLLKTGAEVNEKSTVGETALDWALKFGNRDTIAALSAAGAREGSPYTPPQRPAAKPRAVMQAVESGTALLERSSTGFFNQSGCVGCHNQPITTMAVAAARASGVHVDEAAAKEYVKMMDSQFTGFQQRLLEGFDLGGHTDPAVYSLFAMAAAHYPASTVSDTLAGYVADAQRRDGTWQLGGTSRAPIEEGTLGRTAMALHTFQLYGPPARKAEFERRIARARDWLLAAQAVTNDDAALQLAGLHWAGAGAGKVRALGRALIAAQRQDGGWAQNRNLASDAYATGESLWALKESGVLDASDPVYQRGVKFLLETQWEDGSWYVRSRAPKFQPYFQSGFPFDHNQWISSAATGWAVMALAPAIENEKRASR